MAGASCNIHEVQWAFLLETYSGHHSDVPHCGCDLITLEEMTYDLCRCWLASSVSLINHMATSGLRIKDLWAEMGRYLEMQHVAMEELLCGGWSSVCVCTPVCVEAYPSAADSCEDCLWPSLCVFHYRTMVSFSFVCVLEKAGM